MHLHHPTLLSQLLSQSDRTQREHLAGYIACAREQGENVSLSERTLRRWINGQVTKAPLPAQGRVAHAYWGYPMPVLLAPPPTSTDGSLILPQHTGQPLSLERQIAMSVRRSARLAALAESTNVGPETLEWAHQEVIRLAGEYPKTPAAELVGDLIELQTFLFDRIEGRQRPPQTVELYADAAFVTGMLAKACQDLGRYQQAMGFARTMLVCARNAGHTGLQAWAHNLQSLIEFWFGRPLKAIEYANAGLELCPANAAVGSVAPWLASSAARAWAHLQSDTDTRDALARAEQFRLHHQPDDLDQLGGLFTFPLAKQHYYASGALVCLPGADRDASTAALDALRTYESGPDTERSYSDEAGARCELALARVRSGDLDGAHDALTLVLDLAPAQRIGGIITSTQRVHAALMTPHAASSASARALIEEIEAFTRTPATSVYL